MVINVRKLPEDALFEIINKLTPVAYIRFRRTSRFLDKFAEANRDILNIIVYNTSLIFVNDAVLLHKKFLTMEPEPIESPACEIIIGRGIHSGNTFHIQYRQKTNKKTLSKTIRAISGFRFESIQIYNLGKKNRFSQNFIQWSKVIQRSKCNTLNAVTLSSNQLKEIMTILKPKTLSVNWDLINGVFPDCVWEWENINLILRDSRRVNAREIISSDDWQGFFENRTYCKLDMEEASGISFKRDILFNVLEDWQVGESDLSFLKVAYCVGPFYTPLTDLIYQQPKRFIPFWRGFKANFGPTMNTESHLKHLQAYFPCGSKTLTEVDSWLVPGISSSDEDRWGLLCIKRIPYDEGYRMRLVLTSLSSPGLPLDTSLLAEQLPFFFANPPPLDLSNLKAFLDSYRVEDMGPQFSLFYRNLQRTFEIPPLEPFWLKHGSLMILELPEHILLETVKKMTATSFTRLRRCCKRMDLFAERKRDSLRIQVDDEAALCLFSEQRNQAEKPGEIQIRTENATEEREINMEAVLMYKRAISGFNFKTIKVDCDKTSRISFDEDFILFMKVISEIKTGCNSLVIHDLSTDQVNSLTQILRPTSLNMTSVSHFAHLNEIPYLLKCKEARVFIDYAHTAHVGPEFDVYSLTKNKEKFSLFVQDEIVSYTFLDHISQILKDWQNGASSITHFRVKYVDDVSVYKSLNNWNIADSLENKILLFNGRRVNYGKCFYTDHNLEPINTQFYTGDTMPVKLRAWLVPRVPSSGRLEWAWLSVKATRLDDHSRVSVRFQSISNSEASLDTLQLAQCVPYLVYDYPTLDHAILKEQLDCVAPEKMDRVVHSFLDHIRPMSDDYRLVIIFIVFLLFTFVLWLFFEYYPPMSKRTPDSTHFANLPNVLTK